MTPDIGRSHLANTLHPQGRTARFLGLLSKTSPNAAEFWSERIAQSAAAKGRAQGAPPIAVATTRAPQRHRQGPKPSYEQRRERKREQRRKQRQADELADMARMDAMIGEARARGIPDGKIDIRAVPRSVARMCWLCMGDNSGRAIKWFARRAGNHVLLGAMVKGALAHGRRSWSDRIARGIATYALLLDKMAQYSGRRHGRFAGVVMGLPQSLIQELLTDPSTGRVPHRNTVWGVHRYGGSSFKGTAGWAHAFSKRGLDVLYQQRLPHKEAERCELQGSSGYATARYWLPTLAVELIGDDTARVAWFAWSDEYDAHAQQWRQLRGPPRRHYSAD